MLVKEPFDQCEPHDLQVEADRPVLDVVEVVLDSLVERRVSAPPVDLRPARESGFDLVAKHVLWNLVFELFHEVGAFGPWTDDRHVAAEDVPELRKLVEIRTAEEPAE